MERALRSVHATRPLHLRELLEELNPPQSGWWKCRILYDGSGQEISLDSYHPKQVSSFKIVHDDQIDYRHKWADRSHLDRLYQQRGKCDDIIIIKDGKVTDSYYANLIFKKDGRWFTPESFLLPGVMRQKLLNEGVIQTADITALNIRNFEKVKMINALLGLDGPEVSTKQIFF